MTGEVRRAGGERVRRTFAAALGVSLAAHALLAVLAARLAGPMPPPRRPSDVIEVELVAVEAPRPAASQGPGPRSGAHAPPRRAGGGAASASKPVPAGVAAQEPSRERADVASWFEQHGLGAAPGGAPGANPEGILDVHPHAIVGDAGGSPGRDADGGDAGERARRRIEAIVGEARAADLARYPDARWTDLRDRMAAGFSPPEDLLPRRSEDTPPLEGWSRAAERYGRTGSPDRSPPASGPAADAARQGAERLGFGQGTVALLRLGGGASGPGVLARLVTLVAVEQGEDGRVVHAWLLGSSGSVAHDALAVHRARLMRETPGLDLPHVGRSDWAFTSELVEPPAELFDANFRPVPARERRPRVRTHIELVAVWTPVQR